MPSDLVVHDVFDAMVAPPSPQKLPTKQISASHGINSKGINVAIRYHLMISGKTWETKSPVALC